MFKYHSLSEHFSQLHPGAFFLDMGNPDGLCDYLQKKDFLQWDEHITRVETTGNGWMDLVLRVHTGKRSFIVKQARPWMENHPDIAAPADRIIEEGEYYRLISRHPVLRNYHPRFLYFDESSYMMVLEDIGNVTDFTHIYQKQATLTPEEANALVKYLILLHTDFGADEIYERIYNRSMRKMNFENMFISPFHIHDRSGLNAILPGMKEIAAPFVTDKRLIDEIRYLGRLYESDGRNLVHGDFYPGCWLKAPGGIKIIDPEFCFFGPVEFDIGLFWAHLLMAQQPEAILRDTISTYKDSVDFNAALAVNFAGVEILRRILSPVQLPMDLTLKERAGLMKEARKMLMAGESSYLMSVIKSC